MGKKSKREKSVAAKTATATGMHLDGYLVRLVTVQQDKRGNLKVLGMSKKELLLPDAPEDDELYITRFAEGLKNLLDDYKPNPGKVVTALPRHLVATRNVKLPSQNAPEIEEMILFDVERHVPIPADEMELAFYVLGQPDELHSQVLLFAAPKKELDNRLRIFEQAGLRVDEIYTDSAGIAQSVEAACKDKPVFCLLDLSHAMANLIVLKQGVLYFSRSFSAGSEKIKNFVGDAVGLTEELFDFNNPSERIAAIQEEWLRLLDRELHRSIHAFQNESFGDKVEELCLTGELANSPGLAERVREMMGIPVTVLSAPEALNLSPEGAEKQDSCEYSTALGLALCGLEEMPQTVNLLPKTVIEEREKRETKVFWRNMAALLAVTVVLFGASLGLKWKQRVENLSQLKFYEERLKPRMETMKTVKAELKDIDQYLDRDHSALKVLKNLYTILPENVTVTDLTFTKKKSVELSLWTFTETERNNVQTILLESPHFDEVKWEGTRKKERYRVMLLESDFICRLASYASRRSRTR